MCHVLFMLPVLGLPLFWILPAPVALPVYAVLAAFALVAYALAYRASKLPLENGLQTLIGATGRVVDVAGQRATLRVRGELWITDFAGAPAAPGDEAVVVSIDGLRLTARHSRAPTHTVSQSS